MTTNFDPPLVSLAGWLLRARYAAGITQEELSDLSGVSVRTISCLETGRVTRPRQTTIRELIVALRIDLEDTRSLNLISRNCSKNGS
jgi:transcriptional regulator with XRE-family HTH domain